MKNHLPVILLVDDDRHILEVLETRFLTAGYSVLKANNGDAALEIIKKRQVNLIVSDIKMPNMSGLELYSRLQKIAPGLPIIFLTAYGTIPEAVFAVQAGAIDYLAKPFDGKELVKKVDSYFADNTTVETVQSTAFDDNGLFWGNTMAMSALKETVSRVAASTVNTLILGESGVGKEGVALCVHKNSSRKDGPYIVVDCGSTPPGILESELFGHTKGAFTNAINDKTGLIEAADGGTLFLDEIGNISPEMQHRLLRFLEDRKIRKVGSVEEKTINCRVIAATNADLTADIKKGTFRQDLYYRLRVVTLNIPPLKERKEDIAPLAKLFVSRHCNTYNLAPISIPENTLKWMTAYPWPGNIRELKNCLEAAVVLCKNSSLQPDDLQLEAVSTTEQAENDFSLENSEREAIIRALKKTGGVLTKAADLLDISRRSIHYKLKKYQIQSFEYKI